MILKTFYRKKLIILICRASSQFRLPIKKKLAELKLGITKWKFLRFTISKASSSTTETVELRLHFQADHFKCLRFTFKIFLFSLTANKSSKKKNVTLKFFFYFRRFRCSATINTWTIRKQVAYNKLVQVIYGCDKKGFIIPFNAPPV